MPGGQAVPDLDLSRQGLTPKRRRQLGLGKEGSGTLRRRPVGSLCYAVLVGLVWLSVLAVDAVFCTEFDVLLAHVLATLVVACSLDAEAQGVLSICLVRFECPK